VFSVKATRLHHLRGAGLALSPNQKVKFLLTGWVMIRIGAKLAILAAVAAMSAPQAAAAKARSGQAADAYAALANLMASDRRVAAIGYRLATANAAFCPTVAPQSGTVMHSASQYGPRLRPAMLQAVGAWSGPVLLAVAPGSPAEKAGLAPGDRLIGIGGRSFEAVSMDGKPSYDQVRKARDELASALEHGVAAVTVERDGRPVEAEIAPQAGCSGLVQVNPSRKLNASSDGKNVFISSALVDYARTDEELALIIAHELAHNIMKARGIEPRSPRAKEAAADRIGLYLMRRAGYDVTSSMDLWRRLGRDNPLLNLLAITHPGPAKRAKDLARVADEILEKESVGRSLIPADLETQPL
jgi:beta-barrel assembly-enhancing protease